MVVITHTDMRTILCRTAEILRLAGTVAANYQVRPVNWQRTRVASMLRSILADSRLPDVLRGPPAWPLEGICSRIYCSLKRVPAQPLCASALDAPPQQRLHESVMHGTLSKSTAVHSQSCYASESQSYRHGSARSEYERLCAPSEC